MENNLDALDSYLSFLEDTEPPEQFHRWSFLSACAAQLGRNIWFQHGHARIYPNMFVMLVGAPATRKSTAIKIARGLAEDAGYSQFSFSKSSKQKFLLDWSQGFIAGKGAGKHLDMNALLDAPSQEVIKSIDARELVSECYIAQDEFVDFIGQGNFDFITLLTTLWDNPSSYEERFKNSESISIPNPTVNVLGGITPTSLALALPQEAGGSGFLSRLILVFSNPSGKTIPFPKPPSAAQKAIHADRLATLRTLRGECILEPAARQLLADIYTKYRPNLDTKLEYYTGRRFTHLLKLCMIFAALEHTTVITTQHILHAHSLLHYTEYNMGQALQHIGTARNLEATAKVLAYIQAAHEPLTMTDIYAHTITYFDKIQDLLVVINNLQESRKIKVERRGIVAVRQTQQDIPHMTDLEKYIREYKQETHLHERIELVD